MPVAPESLAVIDFDRKSPTYGDVLRTVPLPPPGTKRIYMDGQLRGFQASTFGVPAKDLPIVVGNGDDFNSPMYGSVDDIKIYRRALTSAEVAGLYAAERVP